MVENISQCGIHKHGYWYGKEIVCHHLFDPQLAKALANFFKSESAINVVDFGCGMGDYIRFLLDNQICCEGYDGNPDTFNLSKGIAQVADLSQPIKLEKCYDWVLSLEVGEHLPEQYERIFIENLHRHNTKGIVLSWAIEGQGGFGHFNEKNNNYIKNLISHYGYKNDIDAENILRIESILGWFKNTIMVFRKN